MRIVKLHEPTGHPFWQEGEYSVELPDGKMYDMSKHSRDFGHGYRIKILPTGIYYQLCYCGSGYGKKDAIDRFPPELIISSKDYDKIEYVGQPLVMSETLKQDLRDNQIG